MGKTKFYPFETRNFADYYQKQCPHCGTKNIVVEKEEYEYPRPLMRVYTNQEKISPGNAIWQTRFYQAIIVFGIVGFVCGLVTGTWGLHGETFSIRGSPFEFFLFLLILFGFYVFYLTIRRTDTIKNVRRITYYKCPECSYHWRFPLYTPGQNSTIVNVETIKSKSLKPIQPRAFQEVKKNNNFSISKWLLCLLTDFSALLWWKKRKR